MIPRASGTKMHADDVEIDEPLVRLPLAEQFPDWADRPLHRVEPEGTESAILPARRTSPSDCFLLAFGVGLEESPKRAGAIPRRSHRVVRALNAPSESLLRRRPLRGTELVEDVRR
jgi:hypothetical protein